MRVRFTPRALRDFAEIADYIKRHSPRSAVRVRADILRSTKALTMFPGMERRQTVEGVRKLVTRRYAYLIYYSIDAARNEAAIPTIQHPSREREFSDD